MRISSIKLIRAVALAVFAGIASPSMAANYYVATTGDDNRTSTQAQQTSTPWKTLQKAADSVGAGDTVFVSAGTYAKVAFQNKHGNANGWIKFKNQNTTKPRISGTADANGYGSSVSIKDSSYIEFDGFELTTPGTNTVGFGAERSHHIRVANCIARDNGQGGIAMGQSDYLFVENNLVYNNSFTGIWHGSGISLYQNQKSDDLPGFHSIVRGNICYNNTETSAITSNHTDGNGIIIDDFRNTQSSGNGVNYAPQTLVENNLCYGNGAKGIQVYLSDNVTVRNNTCYWNNKDSGQYSGGTWRGELNHSTSSNNTWVNNIAVANPAYNSENTAILIAGGGANNVFKNNLTFNGTAGQSSVKIDVVAWPATQPNLVTTTNGNKLGVDPLFVAAGVTGTPNFKLQNGSPAINAGTAAHGLSTNDIEGRSRVIGAAVDMGAYEFGGATGLTARYYNGPTFNTLVNTQIDPQINFDWGHGSPTQPNGSAITSLGNDNFSVRWTGQVQAIEGGNYTFTTTTDDGVRLWIGTTTGTPLIDKWFDQGPTAWTGSVGLNASQKVNIKLEYYERGYGAVAKLFWTRPGQSSQLIPASQFTPES